MRKIFLLAVMVLLSALTSCGIESFEPVVVLNPPLGVTLSNVGGGDYGIVVSFWALNNETYLEGYSIYMSYNQVDLLNNIGFLVPRAGGLTNIPTMPNIAPQSTATLYSFTVSRFTNNVSFILNNTVFFYVKAYSSTYNIESRPSDIEFIQYTY